jgi:hypothetical protein
LTGVAGQRHRKWMNELLVGYAPCQRSNKISPHNHERSSGMAGGRDGLPAPAAEVVVRAASIPTPGKVVARVVDRRRVG